MSEVEFGSAAVYRILKKAGADRVSDDAVEEFKSSLDDIGVRIGRQAVELAIHAGRKTVKAADVKLAMKNFLE
ncbi:MAG TPA: histone family protein [Conexivisphaerales archaeon]|nr:histone family protein [Conexivisphaerales archaeon]